jgi:phospholipase/carboxylesterase
VVTLLLLHGRGHDPASMHALADRLGMPGEIDCVAPAAPGGSWYPRRFVEPRGANEPRLSAALAAVHEVLDDLELRGVAPERTVLGGFSQGACLAADALAGRPRRLGALAVLCGGLIGAGDDELPRPAPDSLGALPVLLTGTEQDSWVPVERVRRTGEVMAAAGAAVDLRIFPPAPHEVHPEELDALRRLVRGVGGHHPTAGGR